MKLNLEVITAKDIIALIAIIIFTIGIFFSKDGVLATSLGMIIAYYFGRRQDIEPIFKVEK